MKETQIVEKEKTTVTTEVCSDAIKQFFRLVFAGDNSLIELFPKSIIVGVDDIKLLNKQITEKLTRQDTAPISFTAIATYENGKSEEYGSWQRFANEDWSTPDVLESVSLTWRFMISIPGASKPSLHSMNLRIASALNPQHLLQAIFSKDPEEVERVDFKLVTMSTRIDFVDHVLSQELLDLVSRWNKGLRGPEYIFPFMKWVKKNTKTISLVVSQSLPIFTAGVCFSYFLAFSKTVDRPSPITGAVLIDTVAWFIVTVISLYSAWLVGHGLASYTQRMLGRFGRFTSLELTRGDKNRQTQLLAKSRNSFWKFVGGSLLALLWNLVGGYLIAILMKK